jgi:putative ABC transport system permease protein
MVPAQDFLALAFHSLLRNRLQTALAMLGVSVGVGALVTSIALGRGAQQAIDDQLRAAGANMIVVTAGNYQIQREQRGDSVAGHEARLDDDYRRKWRDIPVVADRYTGSTLRPALWRPDGGRLICVHYEDDPMAIHDHPTAKERLGDAMAGLGAAATLTREDAAAIRQEIPGIQHVASGVHENARILAGTNNGPMWFTRLHGTEADLSVIRTGWTFPHGSFLTQREVDGSEQVMVLGRVVADRLFGADKNPVGREVRLWNQPFRVTGVIGSRSWATQPAPGDDQFDAVYVPVTTVHRLLNLSRLNTITVTTKSVGDTTSIAKQITELLRRRHHIRVSMADDFTVRTQAQQVLGRGLPPALARVVAGNMASVDQLTIEKLSASLQRANWTMLGLLAGVATVSLLVGGVGVMNLLLLSVTQRTREVGVRIALGARRSDVAAQFVFEAILLSVVGGLLGTLCGVLASSGLEQIFHWSTAVSPVSAVLAMTVAALLGLVFGVYPARRAAQLDPIEALRHE